MIAIRPTVVTLILLAAATSSASAQDATVRLRLADGPALDGSTYTATLVQEIRFGGGHQGAQQVTRDARMRFHFAGGASAGAERARTGAVIDSARASVSSPHGREVVDTRPLIGTRVAAEYARAGGPAEWSAPVPDLAFGDFGGALPVSVLIDFAFPALHGRAVRPGESWERTWQRRQIDGKVWTEGAVTARYTLDRVEAQGGTRLAHVTFATQARTGPSVRGTFVLGVDDGRVREVTVEDTVEGSWELGDTDLEYHQITRITLTLAGSGAHR